MKISTEVLITASLSKVWGALVDFPRYRSWHPLVETKELPKKARTSNITIAVIRSAERHEHDRQNHKA
jgi:hypothetical protein